MNGLACWLCCQLPNCCICCCCPNCAPPIPGIPPPNALGCAPNPPGIPNPEFCCWPPKPLPPDIGLAPNEPVDAPNPGIGCIPPNPELGCPVPNPWLLPKPGWLPPKFIWPRIWGCCCCCWLPPIFPNWFHAIAVMPAPPKLRFCWADDGGILIFWPPPICCWLVMPPQPGCWGPPNDDCWEDVRLPNPPPGWPPPKPVLDSWFPNPELAGWLPNAETVGWAVLKFPNPLPVVAAMLLAGLILLVGPLSCPPRPWKGLDVCWDWNPPDPTLDVVLENGLGPLDIPNVEVPEEPKPVPELKLVLLLLEDMPNKPSSSVKAAYLSPAAAELPDADTNGPNPELEAGCACEGAAGKMIKKKDGWVFGGGGGGGGSSFVWSCAVWHTDTPPLKGEKSHFYSWWWPFISIVMMYLVLLFPSDSLWSWGKSSLYGANAE